MKERNFLDMMSGMGIEGEDIPETTEFIDTGSYIFNALVSASIYGGFPSNRVTALAGGEGTYKSFFAMSAAKQFQMNDEDAGVILYDTEYAAEKGMLKARGIDTDSGIITKTPETLQDLRHQILTFLDKYEQLDASKRSRVMIILDSLGNLPSAKELADAKEGKDVRDMTRTQIIRSIFRSITLKLGILNVPMIVTNHTYDVIGSYVPTKTMSGGGGLKYAASNIINLSKKKDRNGTEVVGNIVKVKMEKSRFSKEQKAIELRANFEQGIERYFGLLPLAEKYAIIKRIGNKYELPDGTKKWEKEIAAEPEKYYTKDILDRLDLAAKREFGLGSKDLDPSIKPIAENMELTTDVDDVVDTEE